MIVQLIQSLFTNEVGRETKKDGRKVAGRLLAPGIYPNWPADKPVPRSAKIIQRVPSAKTLAERDVTLHDIPLTDELVWRKREEAPPSLDSGTELEAMAMTPKEAPVTQRGAEPLTPEAVPKKPIGVGAKR